MEQIFITVFIIFIILLLIGLCLYIYVKFDNSTSMIIPIQPLNTNTFQQNILPTEKIMNQQLSLQVPQSSNIPSDSNLVTFQQSNVPVNTISNQYNLGIKTSSESQNIVQSSSTPNNKNFRIPIQRPIVNTTIG